MTHKSYCRKAILTTTAAVLIAAPALAQEEDTINLSDLTCRSYLMLGGDERDMTTLFMHGYFAGQADMKSVIISDLAAASEKIVADCIDSPDKTLFEVFAAVRK